MSSEAMYLGGTSYFNMKKFEDSINNRGLKRQKWVETRKNMFVLDKLLFFIFLVLLLAVIFVFGRIIYENIQLKSKNTQIAELEVVLDKKIFDNDEILDNIKDTKKYDNLKVKAYLELNMIMPTEKNIIYFDRSDS